MLPGLGDGSEALPVESEDERPKGVEEVLRVSLDRICSFGYSVYVTAMRMYKSLFGAILVRIC